MAEMRDGFPKATRGSAGILIPLRATGAVLLGSLVLLSGATGVRAQTAEQLDLAQNADTVKPNDGAQDAAREAGDRDSAGTPQEYSELADMFANFERITRQVTFLPNGIRTVTFTEDKDLMAVLESHVAGMIARVNEGRDPKIFIQSPTLDILFERGDRIETEIETTDRGIVVVQTSDDPEVVAALHKHAGEVSELVDRGIAAAREIAKQRTHE